MGKTVTIRAAHWEATIDPARGANPVAVRYREKDILAPDRMDNTDPFLVGAPMLLPANRTAEGTFSFEGKTYHLPVNDPVSGAHLHGRLHRQRFAVTGLAPDRVELEYENRGEIYPFPFRIRVSYRVGEEGFRADYRIENRSRQAMPLSFGLHTTFVEQEWFRLPLAACQERDERFLPTGRYVPLNEQERGYCTGSVSRGMKISGYYQAGGDTAWIGPHLCYQVRGFDHWVLYNAAGGAGILCLEPQLGGVNALNDPKRCPKIPGNGTLSLGTRLFWEK